MTLPTRTPRPLDAGVLWAGGVAAAFVAALIVIVGILFCRGVLDIPILAPKGEGVWGDADTVTYAAGAAVAALLATGVMHLLLLSTPKSGMSMVREQPAAPNAIAPRPARTSRREA